jgi:hypothetical protein
MYDLFIATLRCPGCDAPVPAEIQTHLRGVMADGTGFTVGSVIDPYYLAPEELAAAGYVPVVPPPPGANITLLDTWDCAACGTEQWARTTFAPDGTISAIEAVPLDRASLATAGYVSGQDAALLATSLSGKPVDAEDSVEVLLRLL